MKNKKIILFALAAISLIIVSTLVVSFLYKPPAAEIVNYDKAGIKFSYFNSWKISEKAKGEIVTLDIKKDRSDSTMVIEVRELPLSYKNYTFQQIVDAVNLKIVTDNKDWISAFSSTTRIGKTNYPTQQILYETKNNDKQSVALIGQSGTKLFIIVMQSNRSDFDIVSHDLDVITNSIEVK